MGKVLLKTLNADGTLSGKYVEYDKIDKTKDYGILIFDNRGCCRTFNGRLYDEWNGQLIVSEVPFQFEVEVNSLDVESEMLKWTDKHVIASQVNRYLENIRLLKKLAYVSDMLEDGKIDEAKEYLKPYSKQTNLPF